MSKQTGQLDLDVAYERIRAILVAARDRAYQAINTAMVAAYWEIGRTIVEEEQRGLERAHYGQQVIESLARRLQGDFGRGFDRSNLWHMRAFYLAYPRVDAVRRELSWTHYRFLLRVENPDARCFYETEAVNSRWSTRELERQIHSLLFERLALSRDREGVLALAEKGHEIQQPSDLIKDPYVLEFTGLPQNARYLESELYQREITAPDENPPIGIVLCTDKSEAVVRYTLPDDNQQIYASRYKLHLPSESELAAELQRERHAIEFERRLRQGKPMSSAFEGLVERTLAKERRIVEIVGKTRAIPRKGAGK